jgi:hypothetical protein
MSQLLCGIYVGSLLTGRKVTLTITITNHRNRKQYGGLQNGKQL